MTKAKKTKPAQKSNKKKKVAPANRATTRAALQKTPTRGKTVPAKLTEKNMTPKALRTPKTPKMTSAGVAKKPRSSTKSGGRRTTPKKPKNTTSYIMNQRKYGAQTADAKTVEWDEEPEIGNAGDGNDETASKWIRYVRKHARGVVAGGVREGRGRR